MNSEVTSENTSSEALLRRDNQASPNFPRKSAHIRALISEQDLSLERKRI